MNATRIDHPLCPERGQFYHEGGVCQEGGQALQEGQTVPRSIESSGSSIQKRILFFLLTITRFLRKNFCYVALSCHMPRNGSISMKNCLALLPFIALLSLNLCPLPLEFLHHRHRLVAAALTRSCQGDSDPFKVILDSLVTVTGAIMNRCRVALRPKKRLHIYSH